MGWCTVFAALHPALKGSNSHTVSATWAWYNSAGVLKRENAVSLPRYHGLMQLRTCVADSPIPSLMFLNAATFTKTNAMVLWNCVPALKTLRCDFHKDTVSGHLLLRGMAHRILEWLHLESFSSQQ